MRQGTISSVEQIKRCDNCNDGMEYADCIQCGMSLYNVDTIVCFGSNGETWHKCIACNKTDEERKCPECGYTEQRSYGIDIKEGKKVCYICLKCEHTWKEMRK